MGSRGLSAMRREGLHNGGRLCNWVSRSGMHPMQWFGQEEMWCMQWLRIHAASKIKKCPRPIDDHVSPRVASSVGITVLRWTVFRIRIVTASYSRALNLLRPLEMQDFAPICRLHCVPGRSCRRTGATLHGQAVALCGASAANVG